MTSISYQLYCSRNFPPLEATLAMLAGVGYREVEGYGGLYADPADLAAKVADAGLKMTTGHFGWDMVSTDPRAVIDIARTMGMKAVFVPAIKPDMRPTTAAGWASFGKDLAEAGKPIQDAGFDFGWHNHAFEFDAVDGSELPLDLIAAASADLKLELDLGWVAVAGHDPLAWIKKYSGRIVAVHVKDIAPDGQCADEDGWADVGQGTIDWVPIKRAIDDAGITRMVIEHDNPNDHKRFASRSFAAASAF